MVGAEAFHEADEAHREDAVDHPAEEVREGSVGAGEGAVALAEEEVHQEGVVGDFDELSPVDWLRPWSAELCQQSSQSPLLFWRKANVCMIWANGVREWCGLWESPWSLAARCSKARWRSSG